MDGAAAHGPAPPGLAPSSFGSSTLYLCVQRVMVSTGKKQAWDYYSSGADDELTYNENVNAFQRIWLKPRILVDVAKVRAGRMMGTDRRWEGSRRRGSTPPLV